MSSSSRSSPAGFAGAIESPLWPAVGWVAAGVIVQAALAPFVSVHGAMPSAVAIGVALYCRRARVPAALVFGLLTGTLEDALSGGTGAAWTVATALAALAVNGASRLLFLEGTFLAALTAGAVVLVRDALFWFGMKVEGYPSGLGIAHMHAALVSAGESAALTLVLLLVRARMRDRA